MIARFGFYLASILPLPEQTAAALMQNRLECAMMLQQELSWERMLFSCSIGRQSYDLRLESVEALEPVLGQGNHRMMEFRTSNQ